MSIEKALNFSDGFGNYSGDAKPTTYADMYRFMSNQNNVLTALASLIWQPSTAYKVGDVVQAPSMNGYHARCTQAGTSSSDVPTWPAGGTVTDGTVTWTMERQSDINAAQAATNTAQATTSQTLSNNLTNWTHQLKRSTAYAVGDVAYSPNLKSYLYLECTTAGTTAATEPTLSSVTGGATVTDGTVKWAVKTVCAQQYVDGLIKTVNNSISATNTTISNMTGVTVKKLLDNRECYAFKIGHLVLVTFDMPASVTTYSWAAVYASLTIPWKAKYTTRSCSNAQEGLLLTVSIDANENTVRLRNYGQSSITSGWARGQIMYITDD